MFATFKFEKPYILQKVFTTAMLFYIRSITQISTSSHTRERNRVHADNPTNKITNNVSARCSGIDRNKGNHSWTRTWTQAFNNSNNAFSFLIAYPFPIGNTIAEQQSAPASAVPGKPQQVIAVWEKYHSLNNLTEQVSLIKTLLMCRTGREDSPSSLRMIYIYISRRKKCIKN